MLARADYHTVTGTHIDHIKVDGSIIPRRSTLTHAVRGEDIVYWIERINACRSLEKLELNTLAVRHRNQSRLANINGTKLRLDFGTTSSTGL